MRLLQREWYNTALTILGIRVEHASSEIGEDISGGVGGRERLGYGRAVVGRATRGTREDQAETWRRSN